MAITTLSNQHISASYQNLLQISSSNALYNGSGVIIPNLTVTASYATTASYFAGNSVSASYVKLAQSASYVLNAKSASFASTASFLSGNVANATSASHAQNSLTASYAATASLAPLYLPLAGGTIAGNLTVQGTASFAYTTASYFEIGANRIQLNTAVPSSRYAGITVFDSGSIGKSGSLFFDSLNDQWIFIHQGATANATSSLLIMGPQTYGSIGNETYLTTNRIPKSVGLEHIGDSNITDTGTLVTIASNSVVSGSLIVTGSSSLIGTRTITGSLNVTGSTTLNNLVTLVPTTTTPTGQPTGSIIMSGSVAGVKPYYFNGTAWYPFAPDTTLTFGHESTTTFTAGATFRFGQAFGTTAITSTSVLRQVSCPVNGFVTSGDVICSYSTAQNGTDFVTYAINNITTGISSTITTLVLTGTTSGATASGILGTPLRVSKGDKLEVLATAPGTWGIGSPPTSFRQIVNINITTV